MKNKILINTIFDLVHRFIHIEKPVKAGIYLSITTIGFLQTQAFIKILN